MTLSLEDRLSEKVRRMIVAISIAVVLSSGALHAQQQDCVGARLMQIMSSGTSITICAIFGPFECAGYATIVVMYEVVIWFQSGC